MSNEKARRGRSDTGRGRQKKRDGEPRGTWPLLPTHCFSVDSKQYGDKVLEELQGPETQMWSEAQPGAVPSERAGRTLLPQFHETSLRFFPSPVLLPWTDSWGAGGRKYSGS